MSPLYRRGSTVSKLRAITRRQFTFLSSWYSFDRRRKEERLSRLWSHPVALNPEALDWDYSVLTTRSLLQQWTDTVKKIVKIPGTTLENYFGRRTQEREFPVQLGCMGRCLPPGRIQVHNLGRIRW